MSEERGLIEPLSVRLPHSFKHHFRYLNRSFWQGRQGQTFSFSWPIDVLYFPPSGSWIIFFLFSFSFFQETHSRQLRAGNARCFNSSKQPFSLAPNVMRRLSVWAKSVRVSFREYWRVSLDAAEDASAMTLELMAVSLSLWWDGNQIRMKEK